MKSHVSEVLPAPLQAYARGRLCIAAQSVSSGSEGAVMSLVPSLAACLDAWPTLERMFDGGTSALGTVAELVMLQELTPACILMLQELGQSDSPIAAGDVMDAFQSAPSSLDGVDSTISRLNITLPVFMPLRQKLCLPLIGTLYVEGEALTASTLLNDRGDGRRSALLSTLLRDSMSSTDRRLAQQIVTAASQGSNALSRATCSAGEQCVALSNATLLVGSCSRCLRGQHCPSGTTNPLGGSAFNQCQEGRTCPEPERSSECAAGYFCPKGTFGGGHPCPSWTHTWMSSSVGWALQVYCPPGTKQPYNSICPKGHTCPSTSTSQPCQAGFFCTEGGNASTPCSSDLFGWISPTVRCPPGMRYQPLQYQYLLLLLIFAGPCDTGVRSLLQLMSPRASIPTPRGA